MNKTDDFSTARLNMVRDQIAARGVRDPLVLEAMRGVPREKFVPSNLQKYAYDDEPLPIGSDQTISQPYIVAYMIEALELQGGETVLDIGTGSGYAAAVLSQIAGVVYSLELIEELAIRARKLLQDLHYQNVHVKQGDGTLGWPEHAPFDAIVVAAGGPRVPNSLKTQLKIGGRMVIPVGSGANAQRLARIVRISETEYETRYIAHVRFVPLLGKEGWNSEDKPSKLRSLLDPFYKPM